MTILVTGSSGKTARRLTALLQPQHLVLIASRSGVDVGNVPATQFDWCKDSTFDNPFNHPQVKQSPITALYIVAPSGDQATLDGELAFVRHANDKGVKRFVLLGSSLVTEGGPFMGKVHSLLKELGVEWAVLRATWFMATIRDAGKVFSATGRGRVPFVSAEDIAAVAYHALTTSAPPNREYCVLGPALHSYDDVAEMLTEVLGRKIEHVSLSQDGLAEKFAELGMSEQYAQALAGLDLAIASGAEERESDDVEQAIGRKPKGLRQFVEENREVWL